MKFVILIVILYCTVAQKTGPSPKTEKTVITSTSTTSTTALTSIEASTPQPENDTVDVDVTTEIMLTTTCPDNSSCSLTTKMPKINSTTTGPKNKTNKSNRNYSETDFKTSSSNEFCTCDLQLNFCDINCCCDQDCSYENKLIFHHCETENLYYDTRYCDYMKYIYINNTPFDWHVNQNGLFCVIKSNLPPSYTIQRKQPLSSLAEAEEEKRNKFSWSHGIELKKVLFNSSEHFTFGNHIWIVQKDGVKKFQLPKRFLSDTCIIREYVPNMKNIKNICSQIDISEENTFLNFASYFQNISVIAVPNLLNISKYKNIYQECPRNICLPILPKVCDEDFDNCRNLSMNETRINLTCNLDIRHSINNCENAVKKLQYNFYHNGTQGYTKIELLAVLEDLSYEFGGEYLEFSQEFSVNFWWVNQTKNFSAMLSGNPGYLIGKPILIGNLDNVGNNTNVVLKIQRFSTDYLQNFLTLPENVNGHCILNNRNYLSIDFGFNLITKCKFNSTIYNRKKYLNGSEICRDIQRTILMLWGVAGKNKTIGMLGNANANVPQEWIKILYNIHFDKILNRTTGRFSSSNNTLTCFGIGTNLIIDVYHSRIDYKALLNQEKILAVTYSFGGWTNKSLSYNKQKNSTYFELDLESQVVFYDITVQKQKKFVDPPSLEIKLPYDFFYPFIKIENGVDLISANIYFHFCMCLLIVLVE